MPIPNNGRLFAIDSMSPEDMAALRAQLGGEGGQGAGDDRRVVTDEKFAWGPIIAAVGGALVSSYLNKPSGAERSATSSAAAAAAEQANEIAQRRALRERDDCRSPNRKQKAPCLPHAPCWHSES